MTIYDPENLYCSFVGLRILPDSPSLHGIHILVSSLTWYLHHISRAHPFHIWTIKSWVERLDESRGDFAKIVESYTVI